MYAHVCTCTCMHMYAHVGTWVRERTTQNRWIWWIYTGFLQKLRFPQLSQKPWETNKNQQISRAGKLWFLEKVTVSTISSKTIVKSSKINKSAGPEKLRFLAHAMRTPLTRRRIRGEPLENVGNSKDSADAPTDNAPPTLTPSHGFLQKSRFPQLPLNHWKTNHFAFAFATFPLCHCLALTVSRIRSQFPKMHPKSLGNEANPANMQGRQR